MITDTSVEMCLQYQLLPFKLQNDKIEICHHVHHFLISPEISSSIHQQLRCQSLQCCQTDKDDLAKL